MNTRSLLLFFLLFLAGQLLNAQEFIVDATINTPKLQTADPKVFKSLETAIEEFFNSQNWTDDDFEAEERINCQIQLTITEELSETSFRAELAIQSTRPVFNSAYESAMLTHLDKDISFSYEQFQPLIYTENNFNDNLTSILSFYAYIMLGLDYDSFSPFGGEEHFLTAQDVLNTVPQTVTATNKGWRQMDGNRNRYWMLENLLSPRIKPFRQAFYEYHRKGLDLIADQTLEGRANMATAIETINQVNRDYPNAMILQVFANTKANEIIEIFKLGTREEKMKVKRTMTQIDASNAARYEQIGN
jgi:hypothetical protein